MMALGAVLLYRSRLRRLGRLRPRRGLRAVEPMVQRPESWVQRMAFALVIAFSLTIASNWTQNVPERYGARHAGLQHSWLYPDIDTRAPQRAH